jgi:hypothetical protein
MRDNKRSRFSLSLASSVLTVTLSKKSSTGRRSRAIPTLLSQTFVFEQRSRAFADFRELLE